LTVPTVLAHTANYSFTYCLGISLDSQKSEEENDENKELKKITTLIMWFYDGGIVIKMATR